MKYKKQEYMEFDLGDSDSDVEVRCHKQKIVKTRKSWICCYCQEEIPAGTQMVHETAFVEGERGSCYVCIPCMDKAMESCGYEIEPSSYGKDKYPPNGYYEEEDYEHQYPCTCNVEEGCNDGCKGECGCGACNAAYQDYSSIGCIR